MTFCLRRPQIIHDVGFLRISTLWLFNFFLVKRTSKQELQVKETSGKRDEGNFTNITSSTTRLSSNIPYFLFPSISYSPSSSSFFSSSSTSCSSSLRRLESLQALPPLRQGPAGQALASSSPRFQILTGVMLFTSYK